MSTSASSRRSKRIISSDSPEPEGETTHQHVSLEPIGRFWLDDRKYLTAHHRLGRVNGFLSIQSLTKGPRSGRKHDL